MLVREHIELKGNVVDSMIFLQIAVASFIITLH